MDEKKVFEILMRNNAEMLLTFIRALTSDAYLVDEIFQQTMITSWQRLDSFDVEKPFGPWLRGIAKRKALACFRKAKGDRHVFNESGIEFLNRHIEYIDRRTGDSWEERTELLKVCLETLPEAQREAVELRYKDDLKPREIVPVLKVSSETLKKRLQRAKAALFECMQANGTLSKMEI